MGLESGERGTWEGEEEEEVPLCGTTGDGALPRGRVQGDVALRTGDGARRNLGLVAGDRARASSWLLLEILMGGAWIFLPRKPSLSAAMVLLRGLDWGDPSGLERGDTGTSVSELVAVLRPCELELELVRVSDDPPVCTAKPVGTASWLAEPPVSSDTISPAKLPLGTPGSVDDSPGRCPSVTDVVSVPDDGRLVVLVVVVMVMAAVV